MENLQASVLTSCGMEQEKKLDELLQKEIDANEAKIVVLDDDPTGVQTVNDVAVYTDWQPEHMAEAFAEAPKVFYILTNSRGMTEAQTTKAHHEIAEAIKYAGKKSGKPWIVMSRSDSTLRGHYPLETSLLKEDMEKAGIKIDGEIICPFFKEGGRFTIANVHYVKYGDKLVPAGETEFAKDKTFGYKASNLCEYVEEKTGGTSKAENVICISLEDLRSSNFDKIEKQLLAAKDFQKIIVNAMDYCDIKAFCIPLYRAMAKGRNYIFRTAAALVKVLGGIPDKPLLTRKEMVEKETTNGGIVVVGSHTQKTTAQLEKLLELPQVKGIEFNSDLVLEGDKALNDEVDKVVAECERLIREGISPVCYTRRKLLSLENDDKEKALTRSVKISQAVQDLVGKLKVEPAFVVAKGGITSSDVGVKALGVKRATVLGQIRPGIPVWQTDASSKFPGIPYVIFPGNVGEVETLKEAVEILLEK